MTPDGDAGPHGGIVRTSSRFPLKRARSRGACSSWRRARGGQRPPGSGARSRERALARLGDAEWLVVDWAAIRVGQARRPSRALGVIKSHGAQFFTGMDLERRSTLPAGHRTSVFARAAGTRAQRSVLLVLRLWPWQGNDLLYGLLRIELAPTAARSPPHGHERMAPGERAPLASR